MQAQLEEKLIGMLQKCRQTKNLQEAKRLHAYMREHDLETHRVLGNYLVPMLVDCGGLPDAQLVFNRLSPHRNEHSWTSLISAYIDRGDPQHAFILYREMQEDDSTQPNRYLYLALLKACARMKDTEQGRSIHAETILRGLEGDLLIGSAAIGNTLVDMYIKCGLPTEARRVFERIPTRNAVSWSVMIAAYAEEGLDEEVLACFQQMQQEGASPDSVFFICSLKACATGRASHTGLELHGETIKRGLDGELKVGSALVSMYIKCDLSAEAQQVFERQQVRDAVSWAALVASYAEGGHDDAVLSCFRRMELDGVPPDSFVFACSLKSCGATQALETGLKIHTEVSKRGSEGELYVGTTLVDTYIKCGLLGEARQVFDRLPARDAVSWNTLVAGYADHGLGEEVLNCFHQMQQEGLSPDCVTFICSLKACSTAGGLTIGQKIHAEVTKRGLERELRIGNTLLVTYTGCSCLTDGRDVFDKLPVRSTVSWTAMIKAYSENQEGIMALQCFKDMQKAGVKPDSVTFTCLLAACSHLNLVHEGQMYFKVMKDEHEIEPSLDHCACMVDIFARAGHVNEAERFVAGMRLPPSSAILNALLSACKVYGEVEVGQRCFHQLLEANREDGLTLSLMADLYSNAGRLTDANRIEEMRKMPCE